MFYLYVHELKLASSAIMSISSRLFRPWTRSLSVCLSVRMSSTMTNVGGWVGFSGLTENAGNKIDGHEIGEQDIIV